MGVANINSVIGFDLGHGETSLAIFKSISDTKSVLQSLALHGNYSSVTAVAYDEARNVFFGDAAVHGINVVSFDVSFKTKPGEPDFSPGPIVDFVNAVVNHISIEVPQVTDLSDIKFYVGCPSGWTELQRSQYKDVLSRTSLRNLEVVKESRAALIQAIENDSLAYGDLQGAILVIDIGSSTTDVTYVLELNEQPLDFGLNLGGSLIDENLLDVSIEASTSASPTELREVMAENSQFRNRCLLLCREAKESYFKTKASQEKYKKENPGKDLQFSFRTFSETLPLTSGLRLKFDVGLTDELIERALTKPNPKLQGLSWNETFEKMLGDARSLAAAQGRMPSQVILTGGGSRMMFVKQKAQQVFGKDAIIMESEPYLTVARGLARWGRVDLRMERFVHEIRNLLWDQKRGVSTVVASQLSDLHSQVAENISEQIVTKVLIPNMTLWRNNRIKTLIDVEMRSEKEIRDLLKDADMQQKVRKTVETWINKVGEADLFTLLVAEVCKKYGISPHSLRIQLSKNPDIIASPEISAPDELIELVRWAAGAITGTIMGLLATVLFASGVFGIAVAFILYWLGRTVFKESEVDELVRETDIPHFFRGFISDTRIEEIGSKQKRALQDNIISSFAADEEYRLETIEKISNTILRDMMQKVDERKLLLLR